MIRTAILTLALLVAGSAYGEPHEPTVYGPTQDFMAMYNEIVCLDKVVCDVTLTLGNGGIICGPADMVSNKDGHEVSVFHIKPGECFGGFFDDVANTVHDAPKSRIRWPVNGDDGFLISPYPPGLNYIETDHRSLIFHNNPLPEPRQ